MTEPIVISLKDNGFGDPATQSGRGRPLHSFVEDSNVRADVLALLSGFASKPLSQWDALGINVFSAQEIGLTVEDDQAFNELAVFTLGGTEHLDRAWINTHNCMGVIRMCDVSKGLMVQLEIGSRFDQGHRQYFLNYLLSKVFGGSLVSEVDLGRESMWDMLLAYVFRHRLLEASRIGLFKQYQKREHNNLRFRGRLNFDQQIRRNVPFRGELAYTTNEIVFDNPTNHLIRHAMEKVNRRWRGVFESGQDISDLRHLFEQNTQGWQPRQVVACIKQNAHPIRHPFFGRHYEPVRQIALALLRDEGASLYETTHDAEGVVFDGSWLWESYVWTLLEPHGFSHPDNRKQLDAWRILDSHFYPDFYLHSAADRHPRVVFDAKYKSQKTSSDDVRQVLAYMFMMKAQHGGLIKPGNAGSNSREIEWRGEGRGKWHDLSIQIPVEVGDARAFTDAMRESERQLMQNVSRFRDSSLPL